MKGQLRHFLDAKSGVMAIVQTAVANIAVQAANVGCGIITARALGPAGRGELSAIIMWPQFLAYALSFGVPVASVYWIKRRPEVASQLSGAALVLSIASGLLACGFGFVIIPYSLHIYSPGTIRFAQLAVLVCPLALSGVTLGAQVQSTGNFKIYNLFRFLSPLSVFVVLGIEKAMGKISPATAGMAYLLAALPATIWVTMWVWKHFRPTFQRIKSPSKTLLSYGVRAWGADLFATVANQVDRILVVGMLRPEAMGLYVVAQSAAGVLAILPKAVVPVTLPKSSGLSNEEIVSLTGKASRMTLLVMTLASLPLVVLGRFLLKLVYGAQFVEAATVLPFLVIETILDGVTSVLAHAFLAGGFPGTVTLLEGCGLITSLPLLYWLIPIFGMRGAGFALMIGTFMRLIFVLANFPLRMKLRPPNIFVGLNEVRTLLRRPKRITHS